MSNREALQKPVKALLDFLLPPLCAVCGGEASTDSLCADCSADLPRIDAPCPCCAQPSPGGQRCGDCLAEPPHFDATLACHRYAFPFDRIVQGYKYRPDLHLLGLLHARLLAQPLPAVDAVLAVPSAPAHLRARGFNPALELARPLAAHLKKPLLRDACQRPHDAPAQASLPWKQRAANLKNAFTCSADLAGLHILVVDDVMTTGATLNELARTLKRHGAIRVTNLVLARATKD